MTGNAWTKKQVIAGWIAALLPLFQIFGLVAAWRAGVSEPLFVTGWTVEAKAMALLVALILFLWLLPSVTDQRLARWAGPHPQSNDLKSVWIPQSLLNSTVMSVLATYVVYGERLSAGAIQIGIALLIVVFLADMVPRILSIRRLVRDIRNSERAP